MAGLPAGGGEEGAGVVFCATMTLAAVGGESSSTVVALRMGWLKALRPSSLRFARAVESWVSPAMERAFSMREASGGVAVAARAARGLGWVESVAERAASASRLAAAWARRFWAA